MSYPIGFSADTTAESGPTSRDSSTQNLRGASLFLNFLLHPIVHLDEDDDDAHGLCCSLTLDNFTQWSIFSVSPTW